MATTLLEPTGGKPPGHLAKAKWAQKLGTKLLRTKLQVTQHALGQEARRILKSRFLYKAGQTVDVFTLRHLVRWSRATSGTSA